MKRLNFSDKSDLSIVDKMQVLNINGVEIRHSTFGTMPLLNHKDYFCFKSEKYFSVTIKKNGSTVQYSNYGDVFITPGEDEVTVVGTEIYLRSMDGLNPRYSLDLDEAIGYDTISSFNEIFWDGNLEALFDYESLTEGTCPKCILGFIRDNSDKLLPTGMSFSDTTLS